MQVRKRPLNKKEIAKKEEDIITIEPNSNALTVHETKLKVSSWCTESVGVVVFLSPVMCACLQAFICCRVRGERLNIMN